MSLKHRSQSTRKRRRITRRPLALGFEALDARRVLASITGTLFEDLDGSGSQDPGEVAIENRVVYIDQNFDGILNNSEPLRVTDGSGRYSFEDLSTGAHFVRIYDGTGTQSITSPADGRHSVAITQLDQAFVADFGIQTTGVNTAPTSIDVSYDVAEDISFTAFPPQGVVPKGSDVQGHQFIAIQKSPGANGEVTIGYNGMVSYRHLDNFNGLDTASYILHDGRDASETLTLSIIVEPRDDPSEGIEIDNSSVTENSAGGTVIGQLRVIDPDAQDVFTFFVHDPRFQIQDNLLIVAPNANLNFEFEPVINLAVNAINNENNEGVNGVLTIRLGDADDPIADIFGPGSVTVFEREVARDLGTIHVYDEDAGQEHVITLSDDRFELLANNVLALREDSFLVYPDDDGLVLTATVDDATANPSNLVAEITITVLNVIHPPTSVSVSGELREQTAGATVGPVVVADLDSEETHTFIVSDARFEVVAGSLKLKDDLFVTFGDDGPAINLTVTATDPEGQTASIDAEIPVIQVTAPWQNAPENLDVNGDGVINPLDALIILNALNESGPMVLPLPFQGELFVDVNGDGLLTPLDALIIVNYLNTTTLVPGVSEGNPASGESPEDSPAEVLPEGEAIATTPPSNPASDQSPSNFRYAAPITAAPLFAANDNAFGDEAEDWLALNLAEVLA